MIKTVPIIRSSNSWKKLFAQCKKLPKKEKGDVFEHLVILYLNTNAEFQSKLSNVWLLNKVPVAVKRKLNVPDPDEGIDPGYRLIVAEIKKVPSNFFPILSEFSYTS